MIITDDDGCHPLYTPPLSGPPEGPLTVMPLEHLDGCNGACVDGAPRGVVRGAQPRGAVCSSASTGPSVAVTALARATTNAADSARLTVVGRGVLARAAGGSRRCAGPRLDCTSNLARKGHAPPRSGAGKRGDARARAGRARPRHHSEERCGVRGPHGGGRRAGEPSLLWHPLHLLSSSGSCCSG